jgi:signal transduction histidine kinase
LAALLTVIVLMVLVRLPEDPKNVMVTEQNGVYDLTGITEPGDTIVTLPPGSTYYPSILLTPETADSAMPVGTDEFAALRVDYLSQRFMLKLPDNSDTYTLTFTLSGRHAMRVYVNGRLAGQTGNPGTAKQDTEVWENNITVTASAVDGKMDVILNSAQFYHYRSGANLATLNVEKAAGTVVPGLSEPIVGFLVTGALLCAAAVLLGIFLFLSHTKATLYFALACLVMALRECIQSQAWTYFPVSGNVVFMFEYMSVMLLTVFLSFYLRQYAITRFLRTTLYMAVAGSLVYGLILLLADSVFYTRALIFYQLLLIAAIVPGIGGLFWTIRRPNKEQATALYGIAVFYLAALADILMSGHLLGDGHNPTISEKAMLVFVLAQTVSLFLMNNRVLGEAKESEQKLAAEKAALESLDRMKTEFLGNVAHELKTPLAVVSGYAQDSRKRLLEKNDAGEALPGQMQLICAETERMSLMIGQVLDVTRIDEGRMTITPKKVSPAEIIQKTAETYFTMLNQNGNRLRLSLPESLPFMSADADRVGQVLLNLLSNAMRHTQNGQITIGAAEKEGFVEISVLDTGEGICPELLLRLFTRYATGSKKTRTDSGTGLGLFICKHIVEAHSGTISAENQPGGGACFRFTLPIHT